MKTNPQDSIKAASAVSDNGRRGAPIPGCDCVQCFGYCLRLDDSAIERYERVENDIRIAQLRSAQTPIL